MVCKGRYRRSFYEHILTRLLNKSANAASGPQATRFLASQNPALVKRTLLASFTDVLLLPVTMVPRTVGAVGAIVHTGGTAAVNGISMLNPARWGGAAGVGYGVAQADGEEKSTEHQDEKGESGIVRPWRAF